MTKETLTLLGAPIKDEACDTVLRAKLEDLKLMGERLKTIDAHDALFLLRNCCAIPKLIYFLRTTPFFKHLEILQEYDNHLKSILESILNITLDGDTWAQCTLPVSRGGLGIRLASDLALPAFLSSAHGASSAMQTLLPDQIKEEDYMLQEEATTLWKEGQNNNDVVQPLTPSVQASCNSPLVDMKYNQLLESCEEQVDRARLLAVASPNASDWLQAVPIASLGLKLDDASIRIAVGLRLGTALSHPHKCQCGAEVDKFGCHGLSCKSAEGRHPRHSQANDLIKRALGSAQVFSIREPPGLSRSDGKRPDGLTLLPWSQGRSLVWDFTCSDTQAASHIQQTSQEAGGSARQAERKKLSHYEQIKR